LLVDPRQIVATSSGSVVHCEGGGKECGPSFVRLTQREEFAGGSRLEQVRRESKAIGAVRGWPADAD
jgi:hypothetical protein